MSRKRDRMGVIYDILVIIRENQNSIKPTPLLRKSNLSSQSFSEYYCELQKKGLIRETADRDGKKSISLSDKGFKYVKRYQMILGFIDEFDL